MGRLNTYKAAEPLLSDSKEDEILERETTFQRAIKIFSSHFELMLLIMIFILILFR